MNFLHTCLVVSRHPLALTDYRLDLHQQPENFLLLLDQHQGGNGPYQASTASSSHSHREQREGTCQGRHSILKMSISIIRFEFGKFENPRQGMG